MNTGMKKRRIIYVLFGIFSVAAAAGIAVLAYILMDQSDKAEAYRLKEKALRTEIAGTEAQIEKIKAERTRIVEEMKGLNAEKKARTGISESEGMSDLRDQVALFLGEREGTWSVYVIDPDTQQSMNYNSSPQKAASLIKLYIMGAVYDLAEKGLLELTEEIHGLLEQMITVSDNESANELVRRLSISGEDFEEGMAVVNTFARANGYGDTSQGRDLRDFREEAASGENYTSAADCAAFLERVYRGTNVSEAASAEMLGYLKAQTRTGKIPAGLPEGTVCANKTGELSDTENDAAIVYGTAGGDYILCVMSQDLSDTESARETIRELSRMVYDYLEIQ